MKPAKKQDQRTKTSGQYVSVKTPPPLPAEARRSTAAALWKHAPGWAGDDLGQIIEIVTKTRAKTRF